LPARRCTPVRLRDRGTARRGTGGGACRSPAGAADVPGQPQPQLVQRSRRDRVRGLAAAWLRRRRGLSCPPAGRARAAAGATVGPPARWAPARWSSPLPFPAFLRRPGAVSELGMGPIAATLPAVASPRARAAAGVLGTVCIAALKAVAWVLVL